MNETSITIVLDEDQHRRWRAIAGRRSTTGEELTHELIVRAIESDKPGKINPVLRVLERTPSGRPQRFCEYCGDPVSPGATTRRKYCTAKCRVAANRETRRQKLS